ncbi:tetratricopeptide repeat protein [Rhodobacteraceae bacterium RKSG542]|uniref:tetratricopeptide repeat protein n=1 Tax=Pseudovibrio flavus TaxID=2529854 RepID=UPI0012BBBF2B|nr:tetratricopeptide repeat protein [Pseudovibrio flavus]MTI17632.1 tetratricopeptide repeat protein [Pseudovibrio flavus]
MSDIFSEVDEDVRKEQYSRLWKRFAPFVYVVAGLIVVGTAGYRGYEYWQDQRSMEAGQTFLEGLELSQAGDFTGAQAVFSQLEDKLGGYPMLAKMRNASELAAQGKNTEAVTMLEEVSADSSVKPLYKGLADVRTAYLLLDAGDLDGAKGKVEGLAMAGNPWRFAALEVLGTAEYQAGNLDQAKARFDEIVNDAGAPGDFAGRARVFLDLIAGTQG